MSSSANIDAPARGPEVRLAPEFSIVPPGDERFTKSIDDSDRFAAIQAIQKTDCDNWIQRLRDAGVRANRRASPDLLGQLAETVSHPVDTVLCNLLDSDPTACLSGALARHFSREIVAGVSLISRMVGASQTIFCADQRMPAIWWNDIRGLIRKSPARLLRMSNDYPQADPTLLLYTVLNRRLKPGGLPTEQRTVVLDGAAAFAVGRAVLADESMSRVPVAVRDHARELSHFVFASAGMKLGELLASLGITDTSVLIRGGDLLRDMRLSRDAALDGGELVIHTSDPEPDINPDACIRCGWCMEACPTRVQPAVILESAQRDDLDMAERAGIEACIECGICSYVCPSKLPLLEGIRTMKARHGI